MRGLLVLPILFLFSGVSAQNHTADDIKVLQSYKEAIDEHLPSYQYNAELKAKLVELTKDISKYLGEIVDQYEKDGKYEASEIDKVEQAIQELKSRSYEFAFKEAFAAYTVFELIGINHRAEFALDDLKKTAS